MLVTGCFLPAIAKHACIEAARCAWRWQAGMLDSKKGKVCSFNPVMKTASALEGKAPDGKFVWGL